MIGKLKGRSMAELRGRVRQKGYALAERASLTRLRVPQVDELRTMLRPEIRDQFGGANPWGRSLTSGRFFPSCDDLDATLRAAVELDPEFEPWCTDRARRAINGHFDLLGHVDLNWGAPIDWHREPLSGVRAPSGHWSTVAYLDPAVAGDHKLLWELNRHQFLVTLAQAARLTGEERFSLACTAAMDAWMTANPPGRGVNWASSLEVAFRAMSWFWALRLLPEPPGEDLAMRINGHLVRAARHLERYLSTWFSPNTHLTGEALGLLYLGTQLPHFSDAARWRDTGWQILKDQLPKHLHEDGVYFEQATWYHRYTVDFYMHAVILARANDLPVPKAMSARLQKGLEYLQAISRDDGTFPLIGDDDGGKLAVMDSRGQNNSASALAIGAVIFDRDDFATSGRGAGAELAWTLGASAVERLESAGEGSETVTSRAFPTGGTFVMRDNSDDGVSMMSLDCAVHGAMNCGHAHADVLSFDLTARGVPVFVDPGTGTYTADPGIRDRFRSSAAHNTVTIDGQSSSLPAGPFQWRHVARAKFEAWDSTPEVDFFSGSHDGYRTLASPATHRRAVLFVKGAYWVIQDEILSAGDHEILQNFQLAPGLMAAAKHRSVEIHDGDAAALQLYSFLSAGISATTLDVVPSVVSPVYGRIESASAVQLRAKTHGNARIYTLLTLPGVVLREQAVDSAGGLVATLVTSAGRDALRMGPPGEWQLGKQQGDAAVEWSRTAGGAIVAERKIFLKSGRSAVAAAPPAGVV